MGRDSKGHFTSEGNEGRKAGSLNKATKDIRHAFTLLIESNIDTLQQDLDSLEPRERLKLIIELSQYVIPKLRSVDLKSDVEEVVTISFNEEINWRSSDDINFEDN
jgi:hypothetical protein